MNLRSKATTGLDGLPGQKPRESNVAAWLWQLQKPIVFWRCLPATKGKHILDIALPYKSNQMQIQKMQKSNCITKIIYTVYTFDVMIAFSMILVYNHSIIYMGRDKFIVLKSMKNRNKYCKKPCQVIYFKIMCYVAFETRLYQSLRISSGLEKD